jgi:hypothetical protein
MRVVDFIGRSVDATIIGIVDQGGKDWIAKVKGLDCRDLEEGDYTLTVQISAHATGEGYSFHERVLIGARESVVRMINVGGDIEIDSNSQVFWKGHVEGKRNSEFYWVQLLPLFSSAGTRNKSVAVDVNGDFGFPEVMSGSYVVVLMRDAVPIRSRVVQKHFGSPRLRISVNGNP